MMSRKTPRDQRAVTRASGYAAKAETARTMTTLTTVTNALFMRAPPSAPCRQASTKLSRVGAVVGAIGDDVSDGRLTARFTSTYTGKPIASATLTITNSSPNVRHRYLVTRSPSRSAPGTCTGWSTRPQR